MSHQRFFVKVCVGIVALTSLTLTLNRSSSALWRLRGPPSPTYGGEEALGEGGSVRRSHRLDRFARELGAYVKRVGGLPGPSLRASLLEASGTSVWSPQVWVWRTEVGELTPPLLKKRRAQALTQATSEEREAPRLWGEWLEVPKGAERASLGEPLLHVMVSAPELVWLEQVNRALSARPEEHPRLSFRLYQGLTAPQALISIAHGSPQALEVQVLNGGGYEVTLPSMKGEGIHVEVELLARGERGLRPLCQLSLMKGGRLPHAWSDWSDKHLPDEPHGDLEGGSEATHEATRTLLSWVNEERSRRSISPLILDQHLSVVARDHTQEMLTHRYRGHHSLVYGDLVERLKRSGYVALESAENIAEQPTLSAAHEALMQSLGHRRNILDPALTHVGISLVRSAQGWLTTQVFARPGPRYSTADLPRLTRVLQRRLPHALALTQERGQEPVGEVRSRLYQSLQSLQSHQHEEAQVTPERLIEAARAHGVTGQLSAWVTQSATLEGLSLPRYTQELREESVVLFTLRLKHPRNLNYSSHQAGWPVLMLWLYVWRPLTPNERAIKAEGRAQEEGLKRGDVVD